ncbi:acid-sensing ion channel 4-like [Mizuhopecten yessoensis]|uniref:acid-sensing ion channel 4-like n=1 Tax=Mizuhopecten yessoensis TaxID=6573 RepID=UPI000B45EFE9|nr:acid-sensing ion channel 4-like [Mizuhopecten yessoensis]
MIKTAIQLTKKILTCDCPNPCTENSYYQALTSRQWPTNDYAALLMRKSVCDRFPQDDDCVYLTFQSEESLRRNFVKLSVYYEQLNFQSITEEPDIGNAQFASDFGGAIGLWIGLSVLSMCEILYLCGMIGGHFMRSSEQEQPREHRKRNRKRAYRDLGFSVSPIYSSSLHSSSHKDWSREHPDSPSYNTSHRSEPYSPGGYVQGKRINTSRTRMLRAVLEERDYYDGEHRKPRKMPYGYDMNNGYPHQRW